jgi:ATP-dependent RNA helicase DeaD
MPPPPPRTPEPDASPTFADLGMDERVLRALTDVGYESPSPIQAATIPALLAGRHVVGLAQTGTGKTAAFAVPILSRLDLRQKSPQALVLAPTRELALQVSEAFERYAAHLPGVHVLPIYGGQGYGVQLSALRRGVHVVVGTPGRVMDHLDKGTLDLTELRFLVLDEADEMLKMGFAEDVETILASTPADKHVALFSATMPAPIRRIAKKYLTDAAEITVRNKTTTSANTVQRYLTVAHPQKLDALTRILEVESFEGMIVFVRTKQVTEQLAERLRARGFSAAAINGDIVQAQRERTINSLREGKLDILVATDVAARGLDVERVSHVVNYDIPTDTESYVHRVGRTGRAGRAGDAISFVTPRERHLLKAIERATRQPLTQMRLPTVDDVNETRVARFRDAITEALGSDQVGFYRDLVADYEQEHDVPATDIAAALAVLTQDDRPLLMEPEREPAPVRAFDSSREPRRGPWDHEKGRRRDREDGERPRRREASGAGSSGTGSAGGGSAGGGSGRRSRPSAPLATYRISVGKRHKVEPRQIVGAIANEGGLDRSDFGHIDIRGDHSLVELPATLSEQTRAALERTRISGKLIELSPVGEGTSSDTGPVRVRKPRTKKRD